MPVARRMVTVQSRFQPYSVQGFQSLRLALEIDNDPNRFFLIDQNVRNLYQEAFSLIDERRILSIESSESQKTYGNIEPIFMRLLKAGFRKNCALTVIGGGVLQDIGGFVSSVLFRGISWDFIPTTLLAQCDSCVGSKSSVNIGSYKNQIGTFYPPRRINIPFDVLNTLPEYEIRSGLGEMIKLAIIAGEEPFTKLKEQLARFKDDRSAIEEMVFDSLNFKKSYVEKDELDQGVRNLLNYGHTFGHAYESATDYEIPHGIAVVLGIVTATYFSQELKLCAKGHFEEIHGFLREYYIPYQSHLLKSDLESVFSAMRRDKKNTDNRVHCILTRGLGKMEKVPLEMETQVRPLMIGFLKKMSECDTAMPSR